MNSPSEKSILPDLIAGLLSFGVQIAIAIGLFTLIALALGRML